MTMFLMSKDHSLWCVRIHHFTFLLFFHFIRHRDFFKSNLYLFVDKIGSTQIGNVNHRQIETCFKHNLILYFVIHQFFIHLFISLQFCLCTKTIDCLHYGHVYKHYIWYCWSRKCLKETDHFNSFFWFFFFQATQYYFKTITTDYEIE